MGVPEPSCWAGACPQGHCSPLSQAVPDWQLPAMLVPGR